MCSGALYIVCCCRHTYARVVSVRPCQVRDVEKLDQFIKGSNVSFDVETAIKVRTALKQPAHAHGTVRGANTLAE